MRVLFYKSELLYDVVRFAPVLDCPEDGTDINAGCNAAAPQAQTDVPTHRFPNCRQRRA